MFLALVAALATAHSAPTPISDDGFTGNVLDNMTRLGGDPGYSMFQCPPPVYQCCPQIMKTDIVAVPLLGNKSDVFLPVYRRQLGSEPPEIAFVQLHGALMDAHIYFQQMITGVAGGKSADGKRRTGVASKTPAIVVAPSFGNKECSKAQWLGSKKQKGESLYWEQTGKKAWYFGAKSTNKVGSTELSTFEAMDLLLDWVEVTYPQLNRIVLSGFSAGSEMLVRWLILSKHGIDGRARGGTPLQIVLGAPSAELYLSDERPARSCVSHADTGPTHHCKSYQTPTKSSKNTPATCGGKWDKYPYGLRSIDEYMERPYIGNTSRKELRRRFAGKDLWLGVGEKDNKDCRYSWCSATCPAALQGWNRLQRLLNFVHHAEETIPGYQAKYHVFDKGHEFEYMLYNPTVVPKSDDSFFQTALNGWKPPKNLTDTGSAALIV